MTHEHDQSYYEIALTNRQVMSIFVVLLLCILAAFLGGVWLGRDAEPGLELASAQSITAGSGSEPLEQLDFFTRQQESPELAAASPTGGTETAEAKPETEAPAPEPAPQPTAQPVASSPAGPPDPAGSGAAATVPESPDAAAGELVIQVFSSTDDVQARRVVARLRQGGYPAVLSPVEVDGRILHRVRIGPYSDRDEAQVVAESVRRAYKLDTWITH